MRIDILRQPVLVRFLGSLRAGILEGVSVSRTVSEEGPAGDGLGRTWQCSVMMVGMDQRSAVIRIIYRHDALGCK